MQFQPGARLKWIAGKTQHTPALAPTGLVPWALKSYKIGVGDLKDGETKGPATEEMRGWRWSKDPSKGWKRMNGFGQVEGTIHKHRKQTQLERIALHHFFPWDQKKKDKTGGGAGNFGRQSKNLLLSIYFLSSVGGQVNSQRWWERYWHRGFEERGKCVNEPLRGREKSIARETWSSHADVST